MILTTLYQRPSTPSLSLSVLQDNIALTTSNMPDVEYECNFDFLSNPIEQQSAEATIVMETMTSPATKTGDMFTCPVPTAAALPDIPDMEGETVP